MKPTQAIVSIASLIASGSLGVDAVVYDGKELIPVAETIASEQVEVQQIGNIVEARAPWKGEEGLTVQYDLKEPTLTENLRDRRKEEIIYEKVDFGDGGFKIDVLLTEKPTTNRFCYAIQGYENYDFFYQPPLTAEEIAEGNYRPPEIEGSYAVYHKTLKNHVIGQENYATGKVMHIPRPQVWEIGNEEATKQWADLSYDNGQLCVTAPQDFIDNADYANGVRIDPTFGYTTAGASNLSLDVNGAVRDTFTIPENGVIDSISLYAFTSAASQIAAAVYSGSNVVTNGTTQTSTDIVSNAWLTLSFTTKPTVSVGTVYLAADGFSDFTAFIAYDTAGATDASRDTSANDVSFPDPWVDDATLTFNFSIYATYTAIPQNTIRINNGTIRINNGTIDL